MTALLHPVEALGDAESPTAHDTLDLAWWIAEPGVWSAWERGPRGRIAAGFVHRVGDRYLAVDALGAGIGAFDDLTVAQSAVTLAVTTTLAPSVWMREL